jgi:uncharacterized membrane protein YhaH (DUF805 family)
VPALSSQRGRSPLAWLFFGLQGRVSRRVYWLAYLFLIALDSAVLGQVISAEASLHQSAQAGWPFLVLVTLYCNFAVAVKRLHDCGYTGLFALALFVPLVNLAFSIWVGILPGVPAANRFGAIVDAPPP